MHSYNRKPNPMLFMLLAVLFSACSAVPNLAQEPLTGRWEGSAQLQGAAIETIVDFYNDANGLRANISIPDDRVLSRRLANVNYTHPRVHFEVQDDERQMIFDATLSGSTMSGTARMGRMEIRFVLRRTGTVPALPYAQEDVRFRNGDVTLAGTLLIPSTKEPHPAGIYLCQGGQGRPGTWVWIGVEDVATLYEEYKASGARILRAPHNYPWAYEMHVEDPDGHVLRFGSKPRTDSPFANADF